MLVTGATSPLSWIGVLPCPARQEITWCRGLAFAVGSKGNVHESKHTSAVDAESVVGLLCSLSLLVSALIVEEEEEEAVVSQVRELEKSCGLGPWALSEACPPVLAYEEIVGEGLGSGGVRLDEGKWSFCVGGAGPRCSVCPQDPRGGSQC